MENLRAKKAYRRKIHCLACCSSPPLWHAHLSRDPTHWGSLISHPVYGHISTWRALVIPCRHHARSELFVGHIFNPRHSSIMDIIHITGIDVIDSYLHLNGFVRIEHKWSETNYFTMRVSKGWYVRHVTPVTLKWEPCQVKLTAKWSCFSLNHMIYRNFWMFNSYYKENINDQLYYNDYVKSFDHFPYPSTLEPRLKATDCGGSPNIFIRGGSAPRSSPPYPFSRASARGKREQQSTMGNKIW